MKVKELIGKLQEVNPDAEAVVQDDGDLYVVNGVELWNVTYRGENNTNLSFVLNHSAIKKDKIFEAVLICYS